MSKSKRAKKARQAFPQRYTQWNHNPRVQLVAAIASVCAGVIWIVTGMVGPRSISGGGAVLVGLFFLAWGAVCLSFALRTFRQLRPKGKK